MESLPEDVVLEILLRVTGIPDLFRCAVTCTRWLALIADDSFIRRRWPEGSRHRSSLLGFFACESPREEPIVPWVIPTPMPPFTPAPWSPIGHRYGFPNIPEPPGYRALPWTSRCGLLLVCFFPNGSPPAARPRPENFIYLAVYDPLSRKSRELAPLKGDGRLFRILGSTILTRGDCCSNEPVVLEQPNCPAFFKVLVVSYADERYNLHVFTSGDTSWSTPIMFFDPLEHGDIIQLPQANATVCQGKAHWLCRDRSSHYTLNVSTAETDDISLTKLPIEPDQPGFDFYSAPVLSVTSEGTLSLLRLYRKCNRLEIWTRQGEQENGDSMCWHLTKMIQLKRPERSKIDVVQWVCVGEISSTLLIKDNKNCMYIADLEAVTMENVTELFCGVVASATPFEMDWPAFFMSRLAGVAIKRSKPGGAIQKFAKSILGRIFGRLSLG